MDINDGFLCPQGNEAVVSTHWIGGWMGSRTGLGIINKRNISYPYWESNPESSQPVVRPTIHLSDPPSSVVLTAGS
jgi:hypothetical protein